MPIAANPDYICGLVAQEPVGVDAEVPNSSGQVAREIDVERERQDIL
jgi:hypothetical protein